MDVLQDTRDKVIALQTEFTGIKEQIAKNSAILKELHELHIGAKATWKVSQALVGAGKMLAMVAGSSGVLWVVEHFPRQS